MNNDLCLVPGAIDQYIPRATFELLYPGETPAATMPAKTSEYRPVTGSSVEGERIDEKSDADARERRAVVDRWFKTDF